MKTYTIEVHSVPQEFVITADSESEAKEKAEKRFMDSDMGMASTGVYESKVIDVTGEIDE